MAKSPRCCHHCQIYKDMWLKADNELEKYKRVIDGLKELMKDDKESS